MQQVNTPVWLGKTIKSIPRKTIEQLQRYGWPGNMLRVLRETGWRIRGAQGAAEILGIKATPLEARMVKLGIKREKRSSNIP